MQVFSELLILCEGHREPKSVGAVFLLARPTPRGLIRYPKICIPMMFNKLPKKFKARAFLNYKLLNFHLIFKELYKTPPYLVTATFNRTALREIGSQSFSYSSLSQPKLPAIYYTILSFWGT